MTIERPENDEQYDLGSGTVAVWLKTDDGRAIGLIERHPCYEGRISGGAVMLELGYGPTQTWTVEAGEAGVWEGLTLSPSIACKQCSHHGWIRDGKWVDT